MSDSSFYNAPGAAFASGLTEFFREQEAKKRQDMLDQSKMQMDQQRMQHEQQRLDMEKEQHAADLDVKRENQKSIIAKRITDAEGEKDKVRSQQRGDLEKDLANMVPGQIPDATTLQQADSLGLGDRFPRPPQTLPGVAAPNAVPPSMRLPVQPNEPPAQMGLSSVNEPSVRPNAGTAAQIEAAANRKRQQDFLNSMDDTDPRKADLKEQFAAEAAGLKIPPKPAVAKPRVMFDPVKGIYKDSKGSVVTDVPDGANVDRLAEPKDTSATSERIAEQRARDLQLAKEHAYTEFNNYAKPHEDKLRNASSLLDSLDQNTGIGNSTVAAQVVKLAAGGLGSGVKITNSEIDQVMSKSRTKWDDLKMAVQRWNPDSKTPIQFTPEQTQAIRSLALLIQKKASERLTKVASHRSSIDDASDVATVNKNRTVALKDIFDLNDDSSSASKPKEIVYGMDGKVVK